MSFFSDAAKNLADIGKALKKITRDYSNIARLTLDIKQSENEIERNLIEIGKYVLNKKVSGEGSLNLKDEKMNSHTAKIGELGESIKHKKARIQELKKRPAENKG